MKTAEDFLFDYSLNDELDYLSEQSKELLTYLMIEFAKLHVQAALKAAAEEAKVCKDMGELENGNVSFEITECYYDENDYPIYVEEDSILTAYPLENIK